MVIQTKFKASVVNAFAKEFESKGQKVEYYNLGVMTVDGVDTVKCNKDVYEMVVSKKTHYWDVASIYAYGKAFA